MNNESNSKLYLFGAGGWGRAFLNSKVFAEYENVFRNIVFYDSNPLITENVYGKFRIDKKIWETGAGEAVVITSGYWEEIYVECILHGIEPIGIYDGNIDVVCSYKEMCIRYRKTYGNPGFFRYHAERENSIKEAANRFANGEGGIFENMTQVAIMLSNLCNYANIHSKCPASLVKEKEIMSSKNVYKILDELAQNTFTGIICFHAYNEPTMDPRLFLFIKYAKEKMKNIRIMIYSNGFYLNEVMLKEYKDIGADVLILTGYGDKEYKRLITLDDEELPYQVLWGDLDERLENYDTDNGEITKDWGRCRANLYQVTIFPNGDVGTCCLDYRHAYNLGNVIESSVRKVVNSLEMHEFQKKLLLGERKMFPICRKCGWNL